MLGVGYRVGDDLAFLAAGNEIIAGSRMPRPPSTGTSPRELVLGPSSRADGNDTREFVLVVLQYPLHALLAPGVAKRNRVKVRFHVVWSDKSAAAGIQLQTLQNSPFIGSDVHLASERFRYSEEDHLLLAVFE